MRNQLLQSTLLLIYLSNINVIDAIQQGKCGKTSDDFYDEVFKVMASFKITLFN